MTTEFLFYCRSGYEADLSAELDDKCARHGLFGYAKFNKDAGFLRYQLSSSSDLLSVAVGQQMSNMPQLRDLIFARQKLYVLTELSFHNLNDRVTAIVDSVSKILQQKKVEIQYFGDLRVEYPDTEDGKQMAKFSKKFTVPLRSGLRRSKLLSTVDDSYKPYLHVFFEQGDRCIIAVSLAQDRCEHLLGVKRLKFPSDAPSRSTLKLEEAIMQFCTPAQQQELFQASMTAVDLGACPGGWTYQLVVRGMKVEAVDNGRMDEKLMATGLVDYFAADGFTYVPKDGHVDWLVCDMIEQPDRVANLMLQWLGKGLASAAIFNLKLPMKKRYAALCPIIDSFNESCKQDEEPLYMQAKHLYHNRDEVTFILVKNSQMRTAFNA